MKPQEAIEKLQAIKFLLDREIYSDEVDEAIDIAIKALEQEPTNTNLMLMEANINGYVQGLKDSSKAEQEPKTGHWIFCEGIKGKDNVEKCSRCQSHWKEAIIYRNDTQEYLRLRLKYCPECGANMRDKYDDYTND